MSSQDVQDISMVSQDLSGGGHSVMNTYDAHDSSNSGAVEYLYENDAPNNGKGYGCMVSVSSPKSISFIKKLRCPLYIYIYSVLLLLFLFTFMTDSDGT